MKLEIPPPLIKYVYFKAAVRVEMGQRWERNGWSHWCQWRTPVYTLFFCGKESFSQEVTRNTLYLETVQELGVRFCIMIEEEGRTVVGWKSFIFLQPLNISPLSQQKICVISLPNCALPGWFMCSFGKYFVTAYNLKGTRNKQLSFAAWLFCV